MGTHGNPWEAMGILEKGGPWQPWMEIKYGNMMEHDHGEIARRCFCCGIFLLGGSMGCHVV